MDETKQQSGSMPHQEQVNAANRQDDMFHDVQPVQALSMLSSKEVRRQLGWFLNPGHGVRDE